MGRVVYGRWQLRRSGKALRPNADRYASFYTAVDRLTTSPTYAEAGWQIYDTLTRVLLDDARLCQLLDVGGPRDDR